MHRNLGVVVGAELLAVLEERSVCDFFEGVVTFQLVRTGVAII